MTAEDPTSADAELPFVIKASRAGPTNLDSWRIAPGGDECADAARHKRDMAAYSALGLVTHMLLAGTLPRHHMPQAQTIVDDYKAADASLIDNLREASKAP